MKFPGAAELLTVLMFFLSLASHFYLGDAFPPLLAFFLSAVGISFYFAEMKRSMVGVLPSLAFLAVVGISAASFVDVAYCSSNCASGVVPVAVAFDVLVVVFATISFHFYIKWRVGKT